MKLKIVLLFFINLLNAQQYVAPPTTSSGSGGVISDAEMEKCVRIYNEAIWLKEKLEKTNLDRTSSAAVNVYNEKVREFTNMTNYFNNNCAGKQSYSAWKAAQKLNGK